MRIEEGERWVKKLERGSEYGRKDRSGAIGMDLGETEGERRRRTEEYDGKAG